MFADKVRVKITVYGGGKWTEVWVVDDVAMLNSWNQEGLLVDRLGSGSGDANFAEEAKFVSLDTDGKSVCVFLDMPAPGKCKRGLAGYGNSYPGSGLHADGGPIYWEVLEVV